jgi:ADP-ribose pyrophosphatase YjhB (NUDIX family)
MIPEVTRPCAFVFIRDEDRVLLARMRDPSDGTTFLRPLGGGIDVGELATDAARREIREELGRDLRRIRHLGVLENVFTYDGMNGHEICFVFEAEPDGWSIDTFDGYTIPESALAGGDETAVVVALDDLADVVRDVGDPRWRPRGRRVPLGRRRARVPRGVAHRRPPRPRRRPVPPARSQPHDHRRLVLVDRG